MVHVFLDSNILFSDPFFRGNFQRNFINSIKNIRGKIYFSDVVKREVLNNYRKELKRRRKEYTEKLNHLNKLLSRKIEPTYQQDDIYITELENFLLKLEKEQVLEIIPHNKYDIFSKIVERALSNKKPFIDGKEEFKDTVIWLSYVSFVEEKCLEHCFFISNNSKEFFNKDKSNLHQDLLEDSIRFKPYLSIEGLMTDESNELSIQIQLFDQAERLKELLISGDLNTSYIENIIFESFIDDLNSEIKHYIDNLHPYEKLHISAEGAEFHPKEVVKVNLLNFDLELFPDELIVYGSLDVINENAIYFYQPILKEDPELMYFGSRSIHHTLNFSFVITPDSQVHNFEVKKIVTPLIRDYELKESNDNYRDLILPEIIELSKLNEGLLGFIEDIKSASRTKQTKLYNKIENQFVIIRDQIRNIKAYQMHFSPYTFRRLGSSVLRLVEGIFDDHIYIDLKEQYNSSFDNSKNDSQLIIVDLFEWVDGIYKLIICTCPKLVP